MSHKCEPRLSTCLEKITSVMETKAVVSDMNGRDGYREKTTLTARTRSNSNEAHMARRVLRNVPPTFDFRHVRAEVKDVPQFR